MSAASETRRPQYFSGLTSLAETRVAGLRTLIAGRRFRLGFQPVVALSDRRVHHYESLLRPFVLPEGTASTTEALIAAIEAAGLTEELDLAVADQVIAVLLTTPSASVAVNVSGLSMQSRRFRDRLLARLAASGIAASGRLLVELTETAYIDDMQQAADTIRALRAIGVPVCLDDFGAGAAAFRYLRDFRVDFVKLDGAYVQRAADEAQVRRLVGAMVQMAQAAGAQVVAEMIETEQQADIMADLGAEFGQGWLFGRPSKLPGAAAMEHAGIAIA